MRRWHQLLSGATRAQAIAAIEEIGAQARASRETEPSLAGGTAGLAVFHAYLAEARGNEADRQAAIHFLDQAMDAVAFTRMEPSLYSGFTGVAWAVPHLARRLGETNLEDASASVDDALLQLLRQSPWQRDYDLINGLVGFGVYALERLPRPAAAASLELIVDRLDEIAERDSAGATWFTPPELIPEEARQGHYNLGLAHGVPGVIALLGAVCAAGVATTKARALLEDAMPWLEAQRLPGGLSSSFPTYLERGVAATPTRSAWCYGDPGIAAALLVAARSSADPVLERRAIALALRAARRGADESGVVDAGLCHGAAGLGHIFNRFFQATGEAAFADAARFWFERVLEMRQPEGGVAGFFASHRDAKTGQRRLVAETGLLQGAAGIALALLAATTSIEPEWDRMLLISVPPVFHSRPHRHAARALLEPQLEAGVT